jgi:hypothetical protein
VFITGANPKIPPNPNIEKLPAHLGIHQIPLLYNFGLLTT